MAFLLCSQLTIIQNLHRLERFRVAAANLVALVQNAAMKSHFLEEGFVLLHNRSQTTVAHNHDILFMHLAQGHVVLVAIQDKGGKDARLDELFEVVRPTRHDTDGRDNQRALVCQPGGREIGAHSSNRGECLAKPHICSKTL